MICDCLYLEDLALASQVPGVEALDGRSVLVTGASGLIGSCFADMLFGLVQSSGAEIRIALSGRSRERVDSRFSDWKIPYEFVPFQALGSMEPDFAVDYLVHCAASAHPAVYSRFPVETSTSIVDGTLNIMKLAQHNASARVLFVSSSEVYGRVLGDQDEKFSENDYGYVDILDPRSCYPSAKRMAETLCASFRAAQGVDFVVVRPGHIYGPTMTSGDSRAYAQFFRNGLGGEDIVLKSSGAQRRSYCYVIDCCLAMLYVLLHGESGEAFNISNPSSIVTIRQLAEQIARQSGHQVIVSTASEAEAAGFNRMPVSVLDSRKLEGIGWAGRFDLAAGVARTLSALRGANAA